MASFVSFLRNQPGHWVLISILATLMAGFHLFSTQVLLFSHIPFLNIHLAFGLVIVFLMGAEKRPKATAIFAVLAILAIIVTGYIHVEAEALLDREQLPNQYDLIVGSTIIVLVIIAAFMAFGFILPLMSILGLSYAYFGPYLPGGLSHAGIDFERLVAMLTTDLGGIYGTLLYISATFMAIFVLLGTCIENSGAAQYFIDLPLALFRNVKAGGAYSAVTASALMGMGSGSPVANVMTTGPFTIPLMKRSGMSPPVAGGIEAAASTGGQLMPPVMGAVAFVMAQFTGVSYLLIIGYATLPAILYFLTVGFGVYFSTSAMTLKTIPAEEIVAKKELIKGIPNFLPIFVLLGVLLLGYTPTLAAFWAVVSLAILIVIRNPNKQFFAVFGRCLASGGRLAAQFAAAMACISILVKVILATGVGLRLPLLIESYADGNLLIGYLLTALASVILGMGLPTVAAYIVVAVVAVPALEQMGALPLQAHFFVLYFSILSALTPPVALAALAGAKVAEADYIQTSWASLRYGLMAFIIPFLFAYNSSVMALSSSWDAILITFVVAIIGCFCTAAFIQGYLLRKIRFISRALLLATIVGMFGYIVTGDIWILIGGLVSLGLVYLRQRMKNPETVPNMNI